MAKRPKSYEARAVQQILRSIDCIREAKNCAENARKLTGEADTLHGERISDGAQALENLLIAVGDLAATAVLSVDSLTLREAQGR